MLIGELAQKTGLSKDTIRFYEKMGLIEASERKAGSRVYKEFSSEIVERLVMIAQGKSLGFTLSQIKQLAEASLNGEMPIYEKVKVTECKLEEINDKIKQLKDIKVQLTAKLNRLKRMTEQSPKIDSSTDD
jgi:MerR family transcriptional regulator, copper efflux regulator